MASTRKTEPRLVYRIETEDGRGICAATGSPLCKIYDMTSGDETEHCWLHPTMRQRLRLSRMTTDIFAFPSMEALRTWFPQSRGRAAMERHGARGVVYEVPEVIVETPYQCVVDRATAVRVRVFDLEEAA